MGDTLNSWLRKWFFAAPHQSADNKTDQKFFLKSVSILVNYASFWNNSCLKHFSDIDLRNCFAKSLQSILIILCWDCSTLYCEEERWHNWATFEKLILDDSFSFHFYFSKVLLRTCMQTFRPIEASVSRTIDIVCQKSPSS